MRSIALILFVLLAGCSDDQNPGGSSPSPSAALTSDDAPADNKNTRVDVASAPIQIDATAGNHSVGPVPFSVALADPKNQVLADVDSNASAVIAEARWTCESPTCRFKLSLAAPIEDYNDDTLTEVSGSYGSGYARTVMLLGEETKRGQWGAFLRADGASAGVEGEFRLSVFHDGLPAEEYTAF